jgi:hypothetical protein
MCNDAPTSCSQFDLVVVNDPADLATQDHLHDALMKHVLNTSLHHHVPPMLHLPDLQQFISVASGIKVELSESAARLLKAFYIASRKVRVSMSYGTDIPTKALSSLYVDEVYSRSAGHFTPK